jgi:starch synthase
LNGLDTAFFDPSDASVLPATYTAANVTKGKSENKAAISKMLGFSVRREIPMLAMISRLVESKGIDLVAATAERLLALGVRLVVLGTGAEHYERFFKELEGRHSESVRTILRFDRDLSKKLYAAADLFLMPSRTEPCGLAQMIACRYGTVPIVRATGGLYDSIPPYGREGGIGFLFEQYSGDALYEAVMAALSLYRSCPLEFDRLRRAAMQADFGWHRSAGAYLALYRALLEE